MKGIVTRDLPSQARYLRIAFDADPAFTPEDLEKVRIDMLDTPDLFRRHILMDDSVISGSPVYTSYDDKWHCPAKYREEGLPIVPQSIYLGGWDAGQSITPAFCLLQVTRMPFQVHAILEVTSLGEESMQQFAPRVFQAIERRIPGYWNEVRHFADETVGTRSGTDLRSARAEAKKHGFDGPRVLRRVSNSVDLRRSAVNFVLNRPLEMKGVDAEGNSVVVPVPPFMVDARHCPMLREALMGRYQWKITKQEDGPKGQKYMEPEKNRWSHIADALSSACVKVRSILEPGVKGIFQDEDEDDEMLRYVREQVRRKRKI